MSKAKISKNMKTAYHEAGHAVVAFLVGRRFRKATIEEEEDSFGHVLFREYRGSEFPLNPNRLRSFWEKEIMAVFAGPIAVKRLTGRNNYFIARSDHKDASIAAYKLCQTGEDEEAYLISKLFKIRCGVMLYNDLNWVAVETLAYALVEKETIKYKEACEIIRNARARKITEMIKHNRQGWGEG